MTTAVDHAPSVALAIFAHPDDPEVACGGTLARWAAAGATVHIVIATRGEKGSSDPETDPDALAAERAAEAAVAAQAMGAEPPIGLGIADGEVDNTYELRERLVAIIRDLRPDAVVCSDPTAVFFGSGYVSHRDHRELGWAVLDAVAPASASPLYFPGTGPAHHVSEVYLAGTLEPDSHIDIGDHIDAKVDAVAAHRTQLGDADRDWVAELVRSRAADAAVGRTAAFVETYRRLVLAG